LRGPVLDHRRIEMTRPGRYSSTLGLTPGDRTVKKGVRVGSNVDPGSGGRWHRRWHLLATLAVAAVMGLLLAMPVLAQDGEGTVGPQVLGGVPVPDGEYRFMTSIQADLSNRPPYKEHFCGGTLIDADSVMTAAHCAEFIGRKTDEDTLGFKDVRLDVGVTVLNSDQGERRRIERLSHVRIHPNYNGVRNVKFDVAVIQLNEPVDGIEPIALVEPASEDTLESPPGDAIVAGWGSTVAQDPFDQRPPPPEAPKRMQEADPPLVSDEECQADYERRRVPDALRVYPSLMVCAGQEGEDTCQGDSGGPMFVVDTDETRQQIGITSSGLGCADGRFPGVYTEVNADPIYNFITQAGGL
jgi:secreted trypsin-like serine protease